MVSEWRVENIPEDGKCPIMGHKPKTWTLDHDHYDLRARGVISSEANILEGRIAKDFVKYCQKHTEYNLSDVLRNFADYFESTYWLDNKLHYKGVEDLRKHLERCKIESILQKAKSNFNVDLYEVLESNALKADLINKYLELFIEDYENNWDRGINV